MKSMWKLSSLILLLTLVLTGCGSDEKKTNVQEAQATAPVSEENFDYEYNVPGVNHNNESCRTEKKFTEYAEYCRRLADENFNDRCAQAERRAIFDAKCAENFSWSSLFQAYANSSTVCNGNVKTPDNVDFNFSKNIIDPNQKGQDRIATAFNKDLNGLNWWINAKVTTRTPENSVAVETEVRDSQSQELYSKYVAYGNALYGTRLMLDSAAKAGFRKVEFGCFDGPNTIDPSYATPYKTTCRVETAIGVNFTSNQTTEETISFEIADGNPEYPVSINSSGTLSATLVADRSNNRWAVEIEDTRSPDEVVRAQAPLGREVGLELRNFVDKVFLKVTCRHD